MDNLVKKQVIRPAMTIKNQRGLAVNWEVYLCPHCNGGRRYFTLSDGTKVWLECSECLGCGELAVYRL